MGINRSFKVDDVNTARVTLTFQKPTKTSSRGRASVRVRYEDKVNPMQMAIMCGAIANGGTAVNPTYIKGGSGGDLLKLIGFKKPNRTTCLAGHRSKLDDVMRYTVRLQLSAGLFEGLSVCAKTGTAEVGDDKAPNAWMVGYSQDQDAPLAFACVVEEAGFGIASTPAR